MNWKKLNTEDDLQQLIRASHEKPQAIFKHSTRCSISSMVKSRVDRKENPDNIDFNFLDLIAHRSLSNKIAEIFNVNHESPQMLLIKNGECIYDESHNGISVEDVVDAAPTAQEGVN